MPLGERRRVGGRQPGGRITFPEGHREAVAPNAPSRANGEVIPGAIATTLTITQGPPCTSQRCATDSPRLLSPWKKNSSNRTRRSAPDGRRRTSMARRRSLRLSLASSPTALSLWLPSNWSFACAARGTTGNGGVAFVGYSARTSTRRGQSGTGGQQERNPEGNE